MQMKEAESILHTTRTVLDLALRDVSRALQGNAILYTETDEFLAALGRIADVLALPDYTEAYRTVRQLSGAGADLPDPTPTSKIVIRPVSREDDAGAVQYYVGDVAEDQVALGQLIDDSEWTIGEARIVGTRLQPESSTPFILTTRVQMQAGEPVPTSFDLRINGKDIDTGNKVITPTASPNMYLMVAVLKNEEDLFVSGEIYTVEFTPYYD